MGVLYYSNLHVPWLLSMLLDRHLVGAGTAAAGLVLAGAAAVAAASAFSAAGDRGGGSRQETMKHLETKRRRIFSQSYRHGSTMAVISKR